MPFAEHFGDAEATAVVVETTPRIRKEHPKWTTANLSPWVNLNSPIRISELDAARSGARRADWTVPVDAMGGSPGHEDRSLQRRAVGER